MLSNVNIIKEIKKKNIAISPLSKDTIKGASVNLTASDIAWSLGNKEVIDPIDNKIKIPPHDTALILTRELVAVSEKIGGTFHSRVGDVSEGKGHIGTTLNPGWIGYSLIAVHNHTDSEKYVEVDKPFVTLVLEYVDTPSTKTEDNRANRSDIVGKLELQHNQKYVDLDAKNLELKKYLDEFLSDSNSNDFKNFNYYYDEIVKKQRLKHFFNKHRITIFIFILWILFIVLFIIEDNPMDNKYLIAFFSALFGITLTALSNIINKKE